MWYLQPGEIMRHLTAALLGLTAFTLGCSAQGKPGAAAAVSARARVREGDLEGALADYTKAIARNPRNADAYYQRSIVRGSLGDPEGALEDLTATLDLDSRHIPALYNRGVLRGGRGDLEGAFSDYSQVIELEPRHARAHANRGAVRKARGDLQGAISDFSKAISFEPAHAGTYESRAYARYEAGAWRDALADFRKRCDVSPQNQDYPRLRIFLLRARLGERREAGEELSAFWNARSAGAAGWTGRLAAFLSGRLSEAELLAAAVSADPDLDRKRHCEAWFYAGTLNLIDGKRDQARECFQNCLKTGVKHFTEFAGAAAELRRLE